MPQTPERKKQYAKEYRQRKRNELNAHYAKWREENREQERARNKIYRLSSRAKCLVSAAHIRAKRKGIPFNLSKEQIAKLQDAINTGYCELSGMPLTLSGSRSATSPSLDRIEPIKGYIDGNVRIVCHALNAGMGDWGETELRRIVECWLATP